MNNEINSQSVQLNEENDKIDKAVGQNKIISDREFTSISSPSPHKEEASPETMRFGETDKNTELQTL